MTRKLMVAFGAVALMAAPVQGQDVISYSIESVTHLNVEAGAISFDIKQADLRTTVTSADQGDFTVETNTVGMQVEAQVDELPTGVSLWAAFSATSTSGDITLEQDVALLEGAPALMGTFSNSLTVGKITYKMQVTEAAAPGDLTAIVTYSIVPVL